MVLAGEIVFSSMSTFRVLPLRIVFIAFNSSQFLSLNDESFSRVGRFCCKLSPLSNGGLSCPISEIQAWVE